MDIVVNNLTKSFGELLVLNNFSAVFEEGKITSIMAPSGTGKTTLLKILIGLIPCDSGTVTGLDGLSLGAVFQEDRLCENLSLVSNIKLVNRELDSAVILSAANEIGLEGCEAKPVRELSGGMKRRVSLLRALLSKAEVLFLDEPFTGLDEQTKYSVIDFTKKYCAKRTVFYITHSLKEAEYFSDKILSVDSFV